MLWEQVSAWFVGLSYDGVQLAAVVLLQSTVLTGLGLVAGRFVRTKGAALESAVYRTTLAAVILCPAASLALQRAGVEGFAVVLPRVTSPPENAPEVDSWVRTEVAPVEPAWDADSAAITLPSEVPAAEDRPAAVDRTVRARPHAPLGPEGHKSAAGPAAVPSAQTPAMRTPATESKWDPTGLVICLLSAAWLLGSCFLLLRLLAAHLGIMHVRRTACEAGPATLAQCRAVAGRLGVRPPAVRKSPFVTSPCLVGLFRPTVLLSEGDPPDGSSDREVLVHELAHLARRDHVWNLLGRLSVAMLFFQPLLWFLLRRIVRTAEEVCDDYVVDFGLDRRDYARRLTEIAERFLPRGSAAGVGMISLKSLLGRRIVRILDVSRGLSVRVGLRSAAATLLVGGLGTLLVGLLAVGGDPVEGATDGETAGQAVTANTGEGDDDDPVVVEGGTADAEEKHADEAAPRRAADLARPVRIAAGGKPIDVPGFASPFVGDFNEDGKNDLLVGQLDHGRLRIYRNTGSNARPKFDGFEWFTAGGQIASIPAGCAVGFTPQLVDFDGDGRTDIVTGSFAWGLLYVFRRNADGTFAEAEVLEDKDGELQMRHHS
ncbi:MAG: M56 family metallopeptidase, partial [Planctomycetota bacterium]